MSKVLLNNELMFPSDYLAAVELGGRDVTLTIKSVKREKLTMTGGATETKPVLFFENTKDSDKRLILNKTNASTIQQLYGSTAEDWIGQKITLYATTTKFGNETVDCIRIRNTNPSE